jgi:hypothetical protein
MDKMQKKTRAGIFAIPLSLSLVRTWRLHRSHLPRCAEWRRLVKIKVVRKPEIDKRKPTPFGTRVGGKQKRISNYVTDFSLHMRKKRSNLFDNHLVSANGFPLEFTPESRQLCSANEFGWWNCMAAHCTKIPFRRRLH